MSTFIYILHQFRRSLFRRSSARTFDEIAPLSLRKFSYKELKSATNGFSAENAIGKGGSGSVFRGILRDGKTVAVKKLDPSASLQAEQEFQNEVTILGAIKSNRIVTLIGYCAHKKKRILVYEYMPNRSLQELLFSDGGLGLGFVSWDRRFRIIQDVARAIEFLHNECDPPVIHGDIKPSNVLLDWDFRARVSDFGLSRFKLDDGDQFGAEMFSQELDLTPMANSAKNGLTNALSQVDAKGTYPSPRGKETTDEHSKGAFGSSFTQSGDGVAKQWGKDWWWKQDGSGELCSKDYVMEWIGSQICPTASPECEKPSTDPNPPQITRIRKSRSEKEPKKMQDWWKEENSEINRKKSLKNRLSKLSQWIHIRRRRECQGKETGFQKGAKTPSMSSEMWSGELLSSTTSVRGTLCYAAPEHGGGCGFLMEKADIYSLGVLMLVVVSGRRPLSFMDAPMKLERGNLVSFSRQLAQSGSVLELVDERLTGLYKEEEASLCVNLALACLQRMPELRPDIGDVVRILEGEMDLPLVPFEFSPSPPCRLSSTSKRRDRKGSK